MEVLNTTPNVSRFADLLAATTLTLPLTTEGPFTVFAPSDDAIAALSSSTLQGLESDQNALVNLLQNHLVIGSISSDRLVALGSALTVQGNTLTISQQNGTLMVDGAQVIGTAIPAANGVIYIIDQVLMPANP